MDGSFNQAKARSTGVFIRLFPLANYSEKIGLDWQVVSGNIKAVMVQGPDHAALSLFSISKFGAEPFAYLGAPLFALFMF